MSFNKKFFLWLKDTYYLIFRYPSETHLRIQEAEKLIGQRKTNLSFKSYIELKNRHRKIRRFFLGMFAGTLVGFVTLLLVVLMVLNLAFWAMGIKDNPFSFKNLNKIIRNY